MGFGTEEKITYASISNGKISIGAKEGEEGAVLVKYQDNAGQDQITYKKYFSNFTGMLTDIKYKISEKYGTKLEMTLVDGLDKIVIQLKADSSLANRAVNLLLGPNTDLSRQMTIDPFLGTNKKGAKSTVLMIKQNGESLVAKYNKESGGVPEPITSEVMGVKKWDWSPVYNFFYEQVNNVLIPALGNTVATEAAPINTGVELSEAAKAVIEPQIGEDEDEDLPF